MSRAIVHARPAFEHAVIRRIEWLAEHAPEEWLNSFVSALETLHREVESFPEAWPPVKEDARVVVRRRGLPGGLPYVVYYTHLREHPIRDCYLTHLFHERQRRPRIALAQWPW